MSYSLLQAPGETMRLRLLFSFILSTGFFAHVSADSKPHNDLLPLVRFGTTARFLDDEAAFPFLWEFGDRISRINASLAFPICYGHNFKIGGEALNEQLNYNFPHKCQKRWVLQSAVAASYQSIFNFCGLKSLELSAQYSTAPNRKFHKFRVKKHKHDRDHRHHHDDHHRHQDHHRHDDHHRHKDHHDHNHDHHRHKDHHDHHRHKDHHDHHRHKEGAERAIAGSRAFAFSSELTTRPWNGAFLSAAALYDHVDYQFKFSDHKIIDGFGGTILLKQKLGCLLDLTLKTEFRVPYTYYEGRLQWGIVLHQVDMTLGLYGGHTVGKHGLPNSTVAGVEIGFDFGINNFSGISSAGLCKDRTNPYFAGFAGVDCQTFEWLATPVVYIPEVMARPEQRHFKK
ncbi:MAG: hypothetical protein H0T62_01055 [Parachlamydiaceae bacterium]|nr:hypothetical protein [Parachlamydiaceae bacterium]